jgi:hypothetical protein
MPCRAIMAVLEHILNTFKILQWQLSERKTVENSTNILRWKPIKVSLMGL